MVVRPEPPVLANVQVWEDLLVTGWFMESCSAVEKKREAREEEARTFSSKGTSGEEGSTRDMTADSRICG